MSDEETYFRAIMLLCFFISEMQKSHIKKICNVHDDVNMRMVQRYFTKFSNGDFLSDEVR